jgi:hypothetical protein
MHIPDPLSIAQVGVASLKNLAMNAILQAHYPWVQASPLPREPSRSPDPHWVARNKRLSLWPQAADERVWGDVNDYATVLSWPSHWPHTLRTAGAASSHTMEILCSSDSGSGINDNDADDSDDSYNSAASRAAAVRKPHTLQVSSDDDLPADEQHSSSDQGRPDDDVRRTLSYPIVVDDDTDIVYADGVPSDFDSDVSNRDSDEEEARFASGGVDVPRRRVRRSLRIRCQIAGEGAGGSSDDHDELTSDGSTGSSEDDFVADSSSDDADKGSSCSDDADAGSFSDDSCTPDDESEVIPPYVNGWRTLKRQRVENAQAEA